MKSLKVSAARCLSVWKPLLAAATFPCVALLPGSLCAATLIWSGGGGSDNTSLGANWAGTAPVAGDLLHFAGNVRLTPNQVAALSIGSLSFDSGAGAFTLGGNTYTISTAAGVTNNSTSTETINNAITLGIAQTWTAGSGNLVFGGNVANGGFGLTVTGGFDTSITGILSGTGGLTKTGAGTLTLSGVNTYSGTTTVNAGTVSISSTSNLGTGSLTLNGGTLLNTASLTSTRAITLGASGGTLNALSGTTQTRSGVISGVGPLNVGGTGTLVLSAANTYTGITNVNSGVLNIQSAAALGTTAGGTTVASGAALQIQGGIAVGAEGLTLNGSGISNDGALRNISGANSMSGAVNLGSATTIGSDAGTLTLSGAFNNGGFLLSETGAGDVTLSGVMSGAGGLTKNGSGTLTLIGTNFDTFTGTTTVNAGTLILAKNSGTASENYGGALRGDLVINSGATARLANNSQIDDTKNIWINGGTFDLSTWVDGSGTGAIQFTGGSMIGTGDFFVQSNVTTNAAATTATISAGRLLLNLSSGVHFVVASGTTATGIDLSITGPVVQNIAGSPLIKDGAGTLALSGANTYTGATTVNGGALNIQSASALGTTAGGTTVNTGAALQIQGGIAVGAEALTLNGGGIASDGALQNFSGNNSWSGAITLGSASTIKSGAGTLTLSGTINNGGFLLTEGGTGNVTTSGIISGLGGLTKIDAGTLTLGGTNTYAGGTTINAGTVVINSASSLGASSGAATINAGTLEVAGTFSATRNFTLGNVASTIMVDPTQTYTNSGIFNGAGSLTKTGSGTLVLSGANTYTGATAISAGTLREGAANVITDTSAVTVATGATYDLNGFSETIGSLAGGGTVTNGVAGARTLTSGGDNTSTTFSGLLQSGVGTVALTKSGSGTLTLLGANTYTGTTAINAGALNIQNATGLGTTAAGTTVAIGAALQLQGGIAVGAEALTLNGSGVASDGALRNISGNNSYAGAITQASASKIASDAGTLTLGGAIANGGFATTFDGAGNITANGVISGTGSLIKNGSDTLTLTGADTFSGTTTINGGTLTVAGSSGGALASTTAVTVNNTGTLALGASDQINNVATITLAGGTLSKGNFSEGTTSSAGVGALTLTAVGSHIDFGIGTVGILNFASFTPNGNTLTLDNWTGVASTIGNASTDRLIFASDQTTNLSNFYFAGYAPGASEFALGGGYYEVTPTVVPEPSTWIGGALTLLAVGYHQRRKLFRRV